MDCNPLGSSVQGILQAKILEWVAMPSSRGSSWPRDWTHNSYVSCIARRFFTHWTTWEALIYFIQDKINMSTSDRLASFIPTIVSEILQVIQVQWTGEKKASRSAHSQNHPFFLFLSANHKEIRSRGQESLVPDKSQFLWREKPYLLELTGQRIDKLECDYSKMVLVIW